MTEPVVHTVRVVIGGYAVTAWDEVRITRDMLSAGAPWAVTVWRTGAEGEWAALKRAARLYAPVEIHVDDALQLRGELESRKGGSDRSAGAPLTFAGRDFGGTAMSTHVDPRISLRNVTLYDALVRIFAPLGVPITLGVDAAEARDTMAGARPSPVHSRRSGTRPSRPRSARAAALAAQRPRGQGHHVDRFRFEAGTSVWDAAQRLARRHGFLLFPAPVASGLGLILDKPAYDAPVQYRLTRTPIPGRLDWGGNVTRGERALNGADTPARATVFAHSAPGAREDAHHRGVVENLVLQHHPLVHPGGAQRVRYIEDKRATTPRLAENRGRAEINRAMADFDVYTATTPGFDFNGRLWTPNAMCAVEDDFEEVYGDWLVTRVEFRRSRSGGQATDLRLVPKGAIDVQPDPEV